MIWSALTLRSLERLQGNEHPRRIGGGATAAAREGVHRVDGRIGVDDVHHLQQDLVHGLERSVLIGLNLPAQPAGVLLREESLGHLDIQIDGQSHRGQQDHQA